MAENTLQVLDIVEGTSVDGPGLRTAIYFAGCHHACPGCHNPQSWDFCAGRPMTVNSIMEIVAENDFDVTFSGGDPMYQPLDLLAELADRIHRAGHTVWCYTGFTLEELREKPEYSGILAAIDVLVDGPYIADRRDTTLRFRGSDNQRIIHLHQQKGAPAEDGHTF